MRFFNLCARQEISLWELQKMGEDVYEMNLSIGSFRRIKPLAKKSSTKVRIRKRYGLPFFLHRHRRRKMLPAGVLSACLLLLFLSGFIWNIEISGNQVRTNEVIFEFLKTQGVYHGVKKGKVDCKGLSASLREAFDDFTWVSVKIHGTRLIIDIKEDSHGQKSLWADEVSEEEEDTVSSDLISGVTGYVRQIITRAGTAMVEAGDWVEKGQLLVAGNVPILDDGGEIVSYQYCQADADIYVEATYCYRQQIERTYLEKAYTGKKANGISISFFGKKMTLLAGKMGEDPFDQVTWEWQLQILPDFYLPVIFGRIQKQGYILTEKNDTKDESFRKLEQNMKKFLQKMEEKGIQILQNNVKIETGSQHSTAQGEVVVLERTGTRVKRILGE
jgi:similar to stage IV sporulation protein